MTILQHHPQVAIVTSGTEGLGMSIARKLASVGTTVVVANWSATRPRIARTEVEQAGGPRGHACCCDMSIEVKAQRVVKEVIQRFGSLDILINAASMKAFPYADHLASDEWQKAISTDLASAFYFTKHGLSRMTSGAIIINVFSSYRIHPLPAAATFSTAMAAMLSLTRITASQAHTRGIRVNAVLPDPYAEPSHCGSLRAMPIPKDDEMDATDWDQVAATIAFLALRHADDRQGAVFKVHGCSLEPLQDSRA